MGTNDKKIELFSNTKKDYYITAEMFIGCECSNPEHGAMISYHDDDVDGYIKNPEGWRDGYIPIPELHIHVQLSPYLGFWKRIWVAIKYIAGKYTKYSHWNTTMIRVEDAREIAKYCERYISDSQKSKRPEIG